MPVHQYPGVQYIVMVDPMMDDLSRIMVFSHPISGPIMTGTNMIF